MNKLNQSRIDSDLLMIGDLEVDRRFRKVSFAADGQYRDLSLTPIEFRILLCLYENLGRVYSRRELMGAAWGNKVNVSMRSVDTHVSKLRAELGPKSVYIKAISGRGYKLSSEEMLTHGTELHPNKEVQLHDILDFGICW